MLELISPGGYYGGAEINQAWLYSIEHDVVEALPEGKPVAWGVLPRDFIGCLNDFLGCSESRHNVEEVVHTEEAKDRGATQEVETQRENERRGTHRVKEVR